MTNHENDNEQPFSSPSSPTEANKPFSSPFWPYPQRHVCSAASMPLRLIFQAFRHPVPMTAQESADEGVIQWG